jgi:hypothetical protein
VGDFSPVSTREESGKSEEEEPEEEMESLDDLIISRWDGAASRQT